MAVYTKIDHHELQSLLAKLDLGQLLAFSGVVDGVENTTYRLSTQSTKDCSEQWMLTIFEKDNAQQVQFSTALLEHLHIAGLPVPELVKDQQNNVVHKIAGKAAFLASKSPGTHPDSIGIGHCAAVGEFLGNMHRCGEKFSLHQANAYGLDWAETTARALVVEHLIEDRKLLNGQLIQHRQLRQRAVNLPAGPIHADLFRDNTLFDGFILKAVIDFQSACVDWLLLDLAIALNDWASREDGEIDQLRAAALLGAYRQKRSFTDLERQHWQTVLCIAATQFWLSRLLTRQTRRVNDLPELTGRPDKDPDVYARILNCRINSVCPLPE